MRLKQVLVGLLVAITGALVVASPAHAASPFCNANYCGPDNILDPGIPDNLAHIQPWANTDCNTWVYAGAETHVYFQTWNGSSFGSVQDVGTARWRYGTTGTCKGYQWIHFDINPTPMVSRHFNLEMFLWIVGGPNAKAGWTATFTGGQADGDFLSWGVKAGALATRAWSPHDKNPQTDLAWFGIGGLEKAWCSTC